MGKNQWNGKHNEGKSAVLASVIETQYTKLTAWID